MEHDPYSEQRHEGALKAFAEAVEIAGGQVPFANICRCTQGNISQLLRRRSLLPVRFVPKVEAATNVSRHRLRPDVYASLQDRSPDDAEPQLDCSPVMSRRSTARHSNPNAALERRATA